jgi:multidrug efflux pump subunit AcrA (membrane-fusion protein)
MPKKIVLTIIIFILVIFIIWQIFLKKEKPVFSLVEVKRGEIIQKISETGQVKKGELINLSFENSGKIEKIYVKVGEKVKEGEKLIKLDTSQLFIQLREAEANLALAKANLNKLLAGAKKEEIKIAETFIENAKINLERAKENLEDIKALAKENLKAVNEDALNILENSYLIAYNAFNVVDSIQRRYFIKNDQEGIETRENKDKIEKAVLLIKSLLDKAKSQREIVEIALAQTKENLIKIYKALETIREICQEASYRDVILANDKNALDSQKTNINTAITNVTNSQQTITLTKLTNQKDINQALTKVSLAEGELKKAKDNLALIKAEPREIDINLHQAQISQAEAKISLLKNQIEKATLVSPMAGKIAKIEKEVGEIVQPMLDKFIISILPEKPFQIEVNIYEEDIGKIKIANSVDITFPAFPEKIFKGKVIFVDPAEKLIEGVVYYKVTIGFEEEIPLGIKPGMTADVTIITAFKKNVLVLPKRTIQKKDEKEMVEILKNGKIEQREIKIGLEGSNDLVEIISGLKEGEKVIVR